jgi:hypothetical protein
VTLKGYVVLCVVATSAALLVLVAAGGFDEAGIGLYGKIALALILILAIIGGMTLVVLSGARSHRDAVGHDPDARKPPPNRRDGPD